MKKYLLLCILLLCSFSLYSCSSSENYDYPNDFIVVLPDDKEIYLYMPREDAESILGNGEVDEFFLHNFEELGLRVSYYQNLISKIILTEESVCKFKTNINPSSKENDFLNAGFDKDQLRPIKMYILDTNDNFIVSDEWIDFFPVKPERYKEAVSISSLYMYSEEKLDPRLKHPLTLMDWWAGSLGVTDRN